MAVKVFRSSGLGSKIDGWLQTDPEATAEWLVRFLRDECVRSRGMVQGVIGISGGVDSAVSAYLAARAFGADNVTLVRMPYKTSSPDSLSDAEQVAQRLGTPMVTVDISDMVDGYITALCQQVSPTRLGNVCARCRMTCLYDISAQVGGLPIGTSNKTERMLGYFTWHADDAPAVNPLGDLFKTQVWQLAEHLGVPAQIIKKPPTADLVVGQTDEGDLGVTYHSADRVLVGLMKGLTADQLRQAGEDGATIERVLAKVAGTHWKRKLPTSAMLSDTSINDYYLRPVDL